HLMPEVGIVTEEDARATALQRRQAVERGEHCCTIVDMARQAALAQRLAEIAGVGREHDLAAVEPEAERLVPRRMPVRRQADHAAVAEHVVLAIDQAQIVAEIEIARVESQRRAVSGSMPACHSRRCTTSVALGMSALPPTWSKWRCELITRSILPGSRPMAASRALTSSPGAKAMSNNPASRGPSRAPGSPWQPGWSPVSNSARPLGCSMRKAGIGTVMRPSPPSIRRANSLVKVPQVKA